MGVTREDLQEFLTWLDGTSDDFDEEVVKHGVKETFRECFGIEVTDHIGRTLNCTLYPGGEK